MLRCSLLQPAPGQLPISPSHYETKIRCLNFFDKPVSHSVISMCLYTDINYTGDVLSVEEVDAISVANNAFTAAAELGQDALNQVVKLFKIVHKA